MMNEADVHARMLKAMQEAGVRPEIIYAFERTGRVVTEENRSLLTAEELKEWTDAIEDYRLGRFFR